MTDYFITATDTDAGKTHVACALVNALVNTLNEQQNKVAVFKPIAAGGLVEHCLVENSLVENSWVEKTPTAQASTLVNEDAAQLLAQANCNQTIEQVNPILFEEPIAPHIAAIKTQTTITIEKISQHFEQVKRLNADVTVVEGAGGWRLPLGEGLFLSDFVKKAQLPVILVVNMKLGCLNHAILTYEAIINDGLTCVAWVANCPEVMPYLTENITELKKHLPIPLLAQLPFSTDIAIAAKHFELSILN